MNISSRPDDTWYDRANDIADLREDALGRKLTDAEFEEIEAECKAAWGVQA